jgi:hypothetical protein
MTDAERKRLWDEAKDASEALKQEIDCVSSLVRAPIQNPLEMSHREATEWRGACVKAGMEYKEAFERWKAANAAIVSAVMGEVQPGGPQYF